ncbi:MAG: CCA tRNA nucleotidyltransferase, partial [Desulfovibrio sp.]|nr:CCA tRNA nucleotidyltransferase [Desulfovibrio sp.]
MQYYLVGGAVRDMLAGQRPRDLDYVFEGDETLFLREHPKANSVGKAHGIYIVDGHEYAPLNGKTIEEDLSRRDFTVNALALDCQGHLFMHPKALSDLAQKVLRPVSKTIFLDDALRVFR